MNLVISITSLLEKGDWEVSRRLRKQASSEINGEVMEEMRMVREKWDHENKFLLKMWEFLKKTVLLHVKRRGQRNFYFGMRREIRKLCGIFGMC